MNATPAASTDTPLAQGPNAPLVAPALLQRLVQQHGAQWVGHSSLPAWQQQPGDAVLLIAGDAVRFPEGQDVAVVLPQLCQAVGKPLRMGVALPDDEDEVGRALGAQRRPSLVFVRDGRYVTTVSGMHDWVEFVSQVQKALAMAPSRPPIGIAVEGASAPGCH